MANSQISKVDLAVFDLDGTLTRGDTVCEVIARPLGHLARMRELEAIDGNDTEAIIAAREEMAGWYRQRSLEDLRSSLVDLKLAPGVSDGINLLKESGIQIAIASITWEFAVEWLAGRLGIDYYVGTKLSQEGDITHFWPDDKADWLRAIATQLGVGLNRVAVVGDSSSDKGMLEIAGTPFFVGTEFPQDLSDVYHLPDGDIYEIARLIASF